MLWHSLRNSVKSIPLTIKKGISIDFFSDLDYS